MRLPDCTVTGVGKITVFLLHGIYVKRVADMIAGCQFATVSGSGHYPWAENPSEFNRAFFAFLDRHFPI